VSYKFLDISSTPSVRAAQAANGSREMWEKFKGHRTFDRFTDDEVAFIAERDSFYMATVSETGWPYVSIAAAQPASSRCSMRKRWASPIFAVICNTSVSAMLPLTIARR
jgi:hypothetical protein